MTRERTREIQRLEKLLEAGIKLSSVAADLNGKSSRAMLEALLAGQTDTAAMADLAQKQNENRRLKRIRIPPTRLPPTLEHSLCHLLGINHPHCHLRIAP